jgi:hypothetical protein
MNSEAIHIFESLNREYPEWTVNTKALADMFLKHGDSARAAELYSKLLEKEDATPWFPWICDSCAMTYRDYRSFCQECWQWNSIHFNKETAGRMAPDEQPAALPI